MSRRVRVGVLSAGAWSAATHIPALSRRDEVDLVVVSRRDETLARAYAERFGFTHWTTDWREALAHDLDAVVVNSPPVAHEEQVTEALSAGAHVLCEKPFALTGDSAWRMVDAARRNGRTLLVGFGWNFMPLMRSAREFTLGTIAQVEHVTLSIEVATRELLLGRGGYPLATDEFPPRRATYVDPTISGGGVAAVTMSHAFGLLLFVTGLEASEVYSQMHEVSVGLDLHDAFALRFANGAVAALSGASSHSAVKDVHWRLGVYGGGGQLWLDNEQNLLRLVAADGGIETRELPGAYDPSGPTEALVDAALGRTTRGVEASDELGARTVSITEAAYRSAHSGRPERVRPQR